MGGMYADDARALALITSAGADGVRRRLGLCKDLLEQRRRQQIEIPSPIGKVRAAALVDRRVHAIRSMLLPEWQSGKSATAADDLMAPSTAIPTLESLLEAARATTAGDQVAAGLYARELFAMVHGVEHTERSMGLTQDYFNGGNVLAAAKTLIPPEDPSAAPAQKGHTFAKPVLEQALQDGKFTQEQMGLALAALAPEASQASEEKLAELSRRAAELNAKHEEYREKTSAIASSLRRLGAQERMDATARYQELFQEYKAWYAAQYIPGHEEVRQEREKVRAAVSQAAQALQDAVLGPLLQNSPVAQEEAQSWASATCEITPAAAARLKKIGYQPDQVVQDMAEFYRLTGGRVDKLQIITTGARRASASNVNSHGKAGVISIDGAFNKITLWHEMGHHLEADPAASAAARLYIRTRAEANQVHRISKLTGNTTYGKEEMAFKGGFFDPYVGKVYNGGSTEVFSMGLETLADPQLLAQRMAKDPQTLEFVLGYIRNPRSTLGKMHQSMREALRGTNEDMQEEADAAAAHRLQELAGQVRLVPDQSNAWCEGKPYEWLVLHNGAKPVGYVAVEPGREVRIYSVKVRNPVTKRQVSGYRALTVHGDGLNLMDMPTKDMREVLACVAAWAAKLRDDWDARSPNYANVVAGRA